MTDKNIETKINVEMYKCLNHKKYNKCTNCDGFGRYKYGTCNNYISKYLKNKNEINNTKNTRV